MDEFFSFGLILICLGCSHKVPQTERLINIFFLVVLEVGSPKFKAPAWSPSGETLFQVPVPSGCVLTCGKE